MQVVVIPIYKKDLTNFEVKSLRQCYRLLGKYRIVLVCSNKLNTYLYEKVSEECGVVVSKEYFNASYFESISGYNRLLLSMDFYKRFDGHIYMLIYQLDSYIFKNNLEEWCGLNVDYIGAPLIGDYDKYIYDPLNMVVGNGGFSLRKISSFVDRFSYKKRLFSFHGLLVKNDALNIRKFYRRIPLAFLMSLGYRNSFGHYASNWRYNEDDFWCSFLKGTPLGLSTPSFSKAIQFSFERFPSILYQLNNFELPFGCHAWEKYEYESFWGKYIHV
ncbi:DUF5672 family protein [Larkinella bovis]|uniref:DUF5672 family protein n=1 Tax=Larkinella bovis TaxID=683041 RepID=A0ABW0IL76_9BACT